MNFKTFSVLRLQHMNAFQWIHIIVEKVNMPMYQNVVWQQLKIDKKKEHFQKW